MSKRAGLLSKMFVVGVGFAIQQACLGVPLYKGCCLWGGLGEVL